MKKGVPIEMKEAAGVMIGDLKITDQLVVVNTMKIVVMVVMKGEDIRIIDQLAVVDTKRIGRIVVVATMKTVVTVAMKGEKANEVMIVEIVVEEEATRIGAEEASEVIEVVMEAIVVVMEAIVAATV